MRSFQLATTSVLLGLFIATGAHAKDDDPLFIGGVQASSDSSYTYAGIITPIWGGKLGQGWFNRTIASWLTYEYSTTVNGADRTVRAKAPGVETGLGYAWAGANYGIGLSAAIGYRYFKVSPDLPDEDPQGGVVTFSPQVQANYAFTKRWDTDLIASHTFAGKSAESTFGRLRFGFKPRQDWRLGIEGIHQEGENYRIEQSGLFATKYLANGWGVELSGGNANSKDGNDSAYMGLAVSKQF